MSSEFDPGADTLWVSKSKVVSVEFYANGLKFVVNGETVDDLQTAAAELAAASPTVIESLVAVVSAGAAVDVFKKPVDTSGKQADRPPVNNPAQPGSTQAPKCKCGVPYNDCAGKKTKAGAPYKFRWYAGNDCTQKCDPLN